MARANSVPENVLYASHEKPPTLCPPASESRISLTLRSVQEFQSRWTSDFYVESAKCVPTRKGPDLVLTRMNTGQHSASVYVWTIDVKNVFLCFLFFYSRHVFTFFNVFYFGGNVFFICCLNHKKQWACTGPKMSNYTLWFIKTWQYVFDHNSGKTLFDFYNFCTAGSRKKIFTHTQITCSPHLNNVLTRPCENETSYTVVMDVMHSWNTAHCVKRGVKHKVHQVQRKQIYSHKICLKCPPLARIQAHKHIGQLRHQSATAPNHVTHVADAVAAHQSRERDIYVIFTSYVT